MSAVESNKKKRKTVYDVGTLRVGNEGIKYISIEKDTVLKKGDKLYTRSNEENLQNLLNRGIITEAEYENRKSKIPEWIVGTVNASVEEK
jgi:hypothetical protein